MKRLLVFLVLLITINALAQAGQPRNCFSVVVGKAASADGSVLFAHNEDDGGDLFVNVIKVPARAHDSGSSLTLTTGARYPQAEATLATLWFGIPTMRFADAWANEHAVVVASNVCRSKEDSVELTDGGIGTWLRRLVAQRARTAKEGVRVAAAAIDSLGYLSSGRSYVICDRQEGWVLSVVKGRHWIAHRVPDDEVMVLANCYTMGEVDLADTVNVLYSPDLIDYATERGWYDPASGDAFDFARVYGDPQSLIAPVNTHRMWRGINLMARDSVDMDGPFPFSFTPDTLITRTRLMTVLRDHYEGTPLDRSQGYTRGSPHQANEHTICADINQCGFVAQLRPHLPAALSVLWWAPRRPDTQAFQPWYLGILEAPDGYGTGTPAGLFEQHLNPADSTRAALRDIAFADFRTLAEWVDLYYIEHYPDVRAVWDSVQVEWFDEQKKVDRTVQKLWRTTPDEALMQLTEFTHRCAREAWQRARSMMGTE